MSASAKVLASGAAMIIGTTVQEAVTKSMTGLAIPDDIKSILPTFSGCLCTGLLTVSFLFYIDNDPFARFLEGYYGKNNRNLKEQQLMFVKYCAELEAIDLDQFNYKVRYAYDLSLRLQSVSSDSQMRYILKQAQKDLGLSSIWTRTDMDNPDYVLSFLC